MAEKKFLTKAENQIMINLWNLKERGGFTNDIREAYDDPKPAYTTLATFLKILTKKGFVKSNKVGSMLYYIPAVTKKAYCRALLDKAKGDYFDGDVVEFVKFIAQNNKLTAEQKELIKEALG